MIFLFKQVIFMLHVNLPGGKRPTSPPMKFHKTPGRNYPTNGPKKYHENSWLGFLQLSKQLPYQLDIYHEPVDLVYKYRPRSLIASNLYIYGILPNKNFSRLMSATKNIWAISHKPLIFKISSSQDPLRWSIHTLVNQCGMLNPDKE